jgi:hypothetical protein
LTISAPLTRKGKSRRMASTNWKGSASESGQPRRKKVYVCSICKQHGHNVKTCKAIRNCSPSNHSCCCWYADGRGTGYDGRHSGDFLSHSLPGCEYYFQVWIIEKRTPSRSTTAPQDLPLQSFRSIRDDHGVDILNGVSLGCSIMQWGDVDKGESMPGRSKPIARVTPVSLDWRLSCRPGAERRIEKHEFHHKRDHRVMYEVAGM